MYSSNENAMKKLEKLKKLSKEIESSGENLLKFLRKKESIVDNYCKEYEAINKEANRIKKQRERLEMELDMLGEEVEYESKGLERGLDTIDKELDEQDEKLKMGLDTIDKEAEYRKICALKERYNYLKTVRGEQTIKMKKCISIYEEVTRLFDSEKHIIRTWLKESEERKKNIEMISNKIDQESKHRSKLIKKAKKLTKELKSRT